jgi:hypothetical protein
MSDRSFRHFVFLLGLGIAVAVSSAQTQPSQNQSNSSSSQPQPKQQDKPASSPPPSQPAPPAPLFEGKSTLKSSRQGKDTASAGFNGIGPDGGVQNSVLTANPTPADAQHVAAMSATTVTSTELADFVKQGNLNPSKQ